MIHVIDNWYIQVSPNSYDVVKCVEFTDRKTGEQKVRNDGHGYYGSMEDALTGMARELVKEELSEKDLTLREAVVTIIETNARLRKAIEDAVPEMKVVKRK